jgi:AbrB family looped-hinge helix DNA binding protein
MKAKVTTRGQVSIPSEIRKKFNIEPESKVEWIIEGETIKVVPLPKDTIAAFKGRGEKKYTSQHLIKDRGVERKKEHETDRQS